MKRQADQGHSAPDLQIPDAGNFSYLIDYLYEVGPVSNLGMGPAPISWPDIDAWMKATGTRISPMDALLLKSLSLDYYAQHNLSKDPSCIPPHRAVPLTKVEVDKKVKSAFSMLKKGRRSKR